MRLIFARAALLLVALALPASAYAQSCSGSNLLSRMATEEPDRLARLEAEAAKAVNGEGLFWRIEKPGVKPSYLFGTVHLTDDRLTDLPQAVREALTSSERVIVENTDVLDPQAGAAAMAANAKYVSFTDGDTLSAHLNDSDKALLGQFFGGTLAPVDRMKPWMLAVALAVPVCEMQRRAGHLVVDAVVAKLATEKGIDVIGLESVREQLSAFDGIALSIQADFLMSTARMIDMREDLFATMGALYLERRVAMIDALSRDLSDRTGISQEAYDVFSKQLVQRRNKIMAERSAPYVKKGGSFIAVGALHLPYETGLVEEFRKQGYAVTRLD